MKTAINKRLAAITGGALNWTGKPTSAEIALRPLSTGIPYGQTRPSATARSNPIKVPRKPIIISGP
jgi:hypothetical protein